MILALSGSKEVSEFPRKSRIFTSCGEWKGQGDHCKCSQGERLLGKLWSDKLTEMKPRRGISLPLSRLLTPSTILSPAASSVYSWFLLLCSALMIPHLITSATLTKQHRGYPPQVHWIAHTWERIKWFLWGYLSLLLFCFWCLLWRAVFFSPWAQSKKMLSLNQSSFSPENRLLDKTQKQQVLGKESFLLKVS